MDEYIEDIVSVHQTLVFGNCSFYEFSATPPNVTTQLNGKFPFITYC